jgi:serine/threonine-protein kinase
VSIDGGNPIPVCDAQFGVARGASWGDDGTITVAPDMTGGLVRVPASGGIPVPLTTLDAARKDVTHRWPHFLPGSRAVMFTAHTVTTAYDEASIEVQRLDTGDRKTLYRGGYDGRYVPSGHLVFVRHNTLYAAPMDLARLEVTGQAVPVINDVVGDAELGRFEFSASTTGAAVCFTGLWQPLSHSPVWYDRSGRTERLAVRPAPYADPRVSPGGDAIVFSVGDGFTSRLLGFFEPGLKELRRIPSDRFDLSPIWAPDGRHVVFGRQNESGLLDLCWRRADGTGPVQRLTTSRYLKWASSFSPDGRTLVYTEVHPDTMSDIWSVDLDLGDPDRPVPGIPRPLLQTAFNEEAAVVSPDGRWMAYESQEAGRGEIYVRQMNEPGGARTQISRDGGVRPLWVRGRNEIVYLRPSERALMVVPFSISRGALVAGPPAPWPGARIAPADVSYSLRSFDVSPDGTRILVLGPPDPAPPRSRAGVTIFMNFFDELRRKAGER